ncbi:MAG TPA: GNAT family N-acetyltransferase [Candidatus Acidoferrales bacterium]|nr:GNAT family N-acetyltransferase [Candidatus Acidoferrales bacterium]
MNAVSVRVADPAADAAACASIYAPFVRETHVSFEIEPPSATEMEARMRAVLAWTPWLVAQEDDAVLGYAYGSRHRERAGYRWSVDVSVYLDPKAHGRGIGRALYGALIPILQRQGFYRAYAGIGLPNDASVGIHRSFGFEPVGVYRRVGWKLGVWTDVLWMGRDLRDDGDESAPPGEPIPFADLEKHA